MATRKHPNPKTPTVDRFWGYVVIEGEHWLWAGAYHMGGNPVIHDGKHKVSARRWSWVHIGRRACGNPSARYFPTCGDARCVNPKHLRRSSMAEVCREMVSSGANRSFGDRNGSRTHPESRQTGDKHYKAVLTWELVRALRSGQFADIAQRKIARDLGVSRGAIQNALAGRTWKETNGESGTDGSAARGDGGGGDQAGRDQDPDSGLGQPAGTGDHLNGERGP